MKSKDNTKGLSDKELIKKYESGSINLKKEIKKMLDKPNPAVKTEKQKAKK